jgi:uncharacterized protein DUF4129
VHLRTEAMTRCGRILVLAFVLWPSAFATATTESRPQPTPEEITRALDTVKADPNLAPTRTVKLLRWKDSGTRSRSGIPGWLAWLGDFLRWLDQTARVLVWSVALVLVGALVVYLGLLIGRLINRLIGRRSAEVAYGGVLIAPVRVHDLDIRPESLPDDIGGTARRLWDRSEHRAALALLYRGMLSRFVHVHQIPVRDSTTEADCLVLAVTHLEPTTSEYAARLVRVWQRAVYGREVIQDFDVYGLCDGFGHALDRATPGASGGGA